MKYRNRTWRPDPLLALAVLVGIGVVVTTTVQAESNTLSRADSLTKLQAQSARLALHPVKGLADSLELNWLNSALERPAVQQLVNDNRMELAKPFGSKGPQLGFSVRPDIAEEAKLSGDSGVGTWENDRPDLYFSLRRSW